MESVQADSDLSVFCARKGKNGFSSLMHLLLFDRLGEIRNLQILLKTHSSAMTLSTTLLEKRKPLHLFTCPLNDLIPVFVNNQKKALSL